MTAVEWFLTELEKKQYFIGNDMLEAYKQAIEMEKQQMLHFWQGGLFANELGGKNFETYYNETLQALCLALSMDRR